MVTINPTHNQYELVCSACSALEDQLKQTFGRDACGRGLGSLTSSVAGRLPTRLRNQLYSLSRTRNAVVHDGKRLDHKERQSFSDKAQYTLAALLRYAEESSFYKEKETWTEWIFTCPFSLDSVAKREIESALRRQLDERPYSTSVGEKQNGHRLRITSSSRHTVN